MILGVRYGILFALLIALLDFLPVFGTGTVLFPWALIKLLSGEWTFAIGLVVIYVLTQAVRQVVQPKIVGDSIGLPPLLSLIFLYLGFKIKGISGMILAVPIGMFILNLYHYGVFDSMIQNTKLLAEEIRRFGKRNDEDQDGEKVTALLMAALVSLGAATESFAVPPWSNINGEVVDFRGWKNS